MSASLVGSEMCIRDRCSSRGPACADSTRPRTELPESHITHRRRCASQAVSYTHLTLPTICSV
eukprot:7296080-Alexandrium_andersonii.AAC.1